MGAIAPVAAQSTGDPVLGIRVAALIPSDTGEGYLLVGDDGRVVAYGDASSNGSLAATTLSSPIVTALGDDDGYLLVTADGAVHAFGALVDAGGLDHIDLNRPIVGGALRDADEYWLFASDGGVFSFGGAPFHGSLGSIPLNQPIVGGAAAPGGGYWMVAADGGVFAFGGAPFHGSLGSIPLNEPIVSMAPTPDGDGYWLFASDGGVFAFGSAGFLGSAATLDADFTAFAVKNDGTGYWAMTPDGALQTFGSAGRFGSPVLGPPGRAVDPTLERVATFSQPIAAQYDEATGRMVVALRAGQVLEWDPVTDARRLISDISSSTTTSSERGLLGVAVDAAGGRMYLSSTDTAGNLEISEVGTRIDDIGRVGGARRTLLQIDQPFGNHNGGDIHLGPDGMVWISSGDGGSGGDPFDNAQDLTDLLGGILRIDPGPSGDAPYSIPADNPHADGTAVVDCDGNTVVPRPELWAHGLRNPWRVSFDPVTDDLWIADVGQGRREEINVIAEAPSSGGGMNFGWNRREGTLGFAGGGGCDARSGELTAPVHDYAHSGGRCSVTGGVVYRGSALPQLRGAYLFGDFCTGEIWSLSIVGDDVEVTRIEGLTVPSVVEFATDADGEVLAFSISGGVFRLSGD